jgi:predicted Zn-dependent protease
MDQGDRNPPPSWRDYAVILGVVLGFLLLVFWLLGLLVDNLVWLIPAGVEQQLGRVIVPNFEQQAKASPAQDTLNAMLDRLEAHLPDRQKDRSYRLLFIPDSTINAIAIPGDVIVVYGGLVRQAQSENELMMVLGHELGHFANRDHLRGITRALFLQILLSTVFGDAGDLGRAAGGIIEALAKSSYSQAQELQADEFGITLLNRTYNHVAGAVDFFERIGKLGNSPVPFLSTHPHPKDRVAHLQAIIRQRGYRLGEKTPLPADLQGVSS